jgi:hypothetical protein
LEINQQKQQTFVSKVLNECTQGLFSWNPLSPFVKTTNTWGGEFNDLLVLDEMNRNQQ